MNQITVNQLAALDHPTLIDVREFEEFAAGHAPGATNVPLSELDNRLHEVPTNRPVHIICQAGGRSARATEFLTANGVHAIDIAGGTNAWIQGGHRVEKVPA
jgi:rhodanese-related sulfurtransferase